MMRKLFLGLDGGGTKTASVILDETGTELGRGRGGPCNIATCSDEQLAASVSEAVVSALQHAKLPEMAHIAAVCAGVAGYTAKNRRVEFGTLLGKRILAERHRVEPDYKIAYWGATEGEPAIIVSAGTGAVAFGRNEAGEECRVDGRGFLLGDRGSAYDIARWFLKQLMFRLDRGRELDALDRAVMSHIGVADGDDLVEWAYRPFDPGRIASVAAVIGQCAAEGNERAEGMMEGAGRSLRMAVERVRRQLGMVTEAPVYPLGSLWLSGDAVIRGFLRGFDHGPAPPLPNLMRPHHDAAFGAALLAVNATDS